VLAATKLMRVLVGIVGFDSKKLLSDAEPEVKIAHQLRSSQGLNKQHLLTKYGRSMTATGIACAEIASRAR
jgi:hypothetical protein